jgi:hypothetical protein
MSLTQRHQAVRKKTRRAVLISLPLWLCVDVESLL